MTDQPDLHQIMDRAREVHTWFVALQEAGFNQQEALFVMPPLIVAGALKQEP
jgi:hypothetical protein